VTFCCDFETLKQGIEIVKSAYELSGQETINDLVFLLHEENKTELTRCGKPKLALMLIET
jgi:hypothetical protein